MRELLERWAARQPEWCRFAVGHNDLVFVGPTNGVLGETVTLLRLTELHRQSAALILAAVIEAIEARGWRLALVHNPWREERPKWGVWLSRYEEGDLALARRDHEADTPAEAVLSAYLAALEAEADQ